VRLVDNTDDSNILLIYVVIRILDRQFMDLAQTRTTSTSDSPILSTMLQNERAT